MKAGGEKGRVLLPYFVHAGSTGGGAEGSRGVEAGKEG